MDSLNIEGVEAEFSIRGVDLLSKAGQLTAFRERISTEVANQGVATRMDIEGAPHFSRTFALERRQATLRLSPFYSLVTMSNPTVDSLELIAEIVGHAVACTEFKDDEIGGLGYEISLTYEQTSEHTAHRYLADRLFPLDSPLWDGGRRLWGSANLTSRSQEIGGLWDAKVEPLTFDDTDRKVLLVGRLFKAADEVERPNEEMALDSFRKVWRKTCQIAEGIEQLEGIADDDSG